VAERFLTLSQQMVPFEEIEVLLRRVMVSWRYQQGSSRGLSRGCTNCRQCQDLAWGAQHQVGVLHSICRRRAEVDLAELAACAVSALGQHHALSSGSGLVESRCSDRRSSQGSASCSVVHAGERLLHLP
jgi:hypothetical protein